MRYVLPNGRQFVLAYHGQEEWALAVRAILIELGCSEEYANRSADEIRAARPA